MFLEVRLERGLAEGVVVMVLKYSVFSGADFELCLTILRKLIQNLYYFSLGMNAATYRLCLATGVENHRFH